MSAAAEGAAPAWSAGEAPAGGPRAIVRLAGVCKDYGEGDARLRILQGIDLELREGELAGIVGASGSGKSTLLNILGCLDRPSAGHYWLGGDDVAAMDDDALSRARNRSIGFVFQSFHLIAQLDVVENVEVPLFYRRVPRRLRRERCVEMLGAVGLSHRLGHYPSQLSGGEQQRVAVARALVTDPLLVLADEPTGNLDSRSGEEVMGLFHRLHAEGRTILLVTHNHEIASGLPRVVEMRDGILVGAPGRARAEAGA